MAERRGRERFVTEQPPYSILVRGIEADVLPVCQQYGMGVIRWSPLAGGWLSGTLREGKDNTGAARSAHLPAATTCRAREPAQARGRRPSWPAGRRGRADPDRAGPRVRARAPGVTCAIIGPRTMEQLESQLARPTSARPRRPRPHRRDRPARRRPQPGRWTLAAHRRSPTRPGAGAPEAGVIRAVAHSSGSRDPR